MVFRCFRKNWNYWGAENFVDDLTMIPLRPVRFRHARQRRNKQPSHSRVSCRSPRRSEGGTEHVACTWLRTTLFGESRLCIMTLWYERVHRVGIGVGGVRP